MSVRISTPAFYTSALNAMQLQQSSLAQLQNQISLDKKVVTPADDPVAAVHILQLQRAQLESDQFGKNISLVQSRLSQEDSALADSNTTLQQARELIVEGSNTATMSDSDRQSLATSLQGRLQDLMSIANRQDGNGEYLFSGYATQTQPFSLNGSGTVTYSGDQGNRLVQVSSTQRVADSNSGSDVFQKIASGNGTFSTGANSSNTGTGVITTGSVVTPSAWVADNYTISFTSATNWQVTDSASPTPNVVASGTYTAGSEIAFKGVQVEISGTPAAGDKFAVSKSTNQDIFTTLQNAITALKQPATSPAALAKLSSTLGGTLQQIDQASDHLSSVRADVGSRVNSLTDAESTRQDLNVDLQSSISDLQDLDYASALTKFNQQTVALQAAQLSYTKVAQLSLFNYLT